jgi:oxygen-independent coproporphyrinogen-3 oxidase
MAGLYIHIPFCKSRCIYCGFYSTTRLDLRQQYVDALCREMVIRGTRKEERGRRNEIRGSVLGDSVAEPISTIYLGGGTPSQLTTDQLRQLFIYINKVYAPRATEVTIEMNPDDVTTEYAAVLQLLGINRVSMGAQTFDDRRLRFLRRRHTAAQVRDAVDTLRAAGIANISVDLMYGFPGETLTDWDSDISAALALDVEHISAYCLTIEEGTPLWRLMMKDERLKIKDEETERAMYYRLIDRLTAAGYEHYEISNFARPGRRSRHNSSYWTGVPYIGLGAAAHSFDGKERSWNAADLRAYIAAIDRGQRPCEVELLTPRDRYNERVMLSLRTADGLDLCTLTAADRRYCLREAEPFIADGMLRKTSHEDSPHVRLVLTKQGLFVSDYVISSLMQA